MKILNGIGFSGGGLRVLAMVSGALGLLVDRGIARPDSKLLFEQNCMACHQLENKKKPVVGPSLVEIAHLYKDDVVGFVKWCNVPGKKRKDAVQMPSMAHVGKKGLEGIHGWILEATKGKKFVVKKPKNKDRYAGPVVKGPKLQRIFLKDSSPASIAVTIDGQHSLCWDTVSCRMRYVWLGGFIDGYPYWKGNGNAFAKTVGEIYYRAPMGQVSGLVGVGGSEAPVFKGYKMVKGLPVFSYSLGGAMVSEAILDRSGSLVIRVRIDSGKGVGGEVRYPLGNLDGSQFRYSKGKLVDGVLVLTAAEAVDFELVFDVKK